MNFGTIDGARHDEYIKMNQEEFWISDFCIYKLKQVP